MYRVMPKTDHARYDRALCRQEPLQIALGGDKGFDAADFIMELREINSDAARGPKHDPAGPPSTGARLHHPGYDISQRVRKRIEGLRMD